jgi:hypothetical protein
VQRHTRRRERKDQDWDTEALLQELNNGVAPSSSARWFVALPSPLRAPYKAAATVTSVMDRAPETDVPVLHDTEADAFYEREEKAEKIRRMPKQSVRKKIHAREHWLF